MTFGITDLGEYSNPFFVVQIAPIQNRASSSSKRTTKRRFFFSTKEEDAGKGNDDSVLLAASWKKAIIALHPKEKDTEREGAFEKRFNKKALRNWGAKKRRDIFAEKKERTTQKKKVLRKS